MSVDGEHMTDNGNLVGVSVPADFGDPVGFGVATDNWIKEGPGIELIYEVLKVGTADCQEKCTSFEKRRCET